jgi:GTP cyclohydrolase I
MATLYISEHTVIGLDRADRVAQAVTVPPIAEQTITLTATSAQSSALNAQTTVIRVQADFPCFVAFGTNPTAATTSMPLSSGIPEYFTVPVNTSLKVAARTA